MLGRGEGLEHLLGAHVRRTCGHLVPTGPGSGRHANDASGAGPGGKASGRSAGRHGNGELKEHGEARANEQEKLYFSPSRKVISGMQTTNNKQEPLRLFSSSYNKQKSSHIRNIIVQ